MAAKYLTTGLLLLASACTAGPAYLELGEARELTPPPGASAESPPTLTFSPDGNRTWAWLAVRDSATTRRIVVASDSAILADLPDTVSGATSLADAFQLEYASDGRLYATYRTPSELLPGRWRVTESGDGGKTWTASRGASIDSSAACTCCMPVVRRGADASLFAALRSGSGPSRVAVLTSMDGGGSWKPPVFLPDQGLPTAGCPGAAPSLRVDDRGHVHVAWWAGGSDTAGVYYARSTDGGLSFGRAIALGIGRFTEPAHVDLAVDGDSIVVVAWDDTRGPRSRTTVRASRNGGRKFGPGLVMSDSLAAARYPRVASRRGEVTVTWIEHLELAPPAQAPDSAAALRPPPAGGSRIVVRNGRVR